jgi:hypothetical protein
MVRPARQQSGDATFHAAEKNFMTKGRTEPKGDAEQERRADTPRREGGDRRREDGDRRGTGQRGEREDALEERENAREEREEEMDRTHRGEPRR